MISGEDVSLFHWSQHIIDAVRGCVQPYPDIGSFSDTQPITFITQPNHVDCRS